MKSELKFKNEVFEYPCLAISDDGLVVLFNSYSTGAALIRTEHNEFGEYSDEWDMNRFQLFKNVIELSNY